jgi:hypothetical protein
VTIRTMIAVLALASSATAGVPVKAADRQTQEKASKTLRAAFRSPQALRTAKIAGQFVVLGPRLWASTATARQAFGDALKETHDVVSVPGIVERWSLRPLDLLTLPVETRSTFQDMAKMGTIVPAGVITQRIPEVLAALVVERVPAEAFGLRPRPPTEEELLYYWALVPYDLQDPILVLASGPHSFLCDFHNGKLSFFEEL